MGGQRSDEKRHYQADVFILDVKTRNANKVIAKYDWAFVCPSRLEKIREGVICGLVMD